MIIKNARTQKGVTDIVIEDGMIAYVGSVEFEGDIDAGGRIVIPGLVDTHIHGFGGYEVNSAQISEMSRILARNGTTSFLATAMTDDPDRISDICSRGYKCDGAELIGFQHEGPYISKKRKGAQNEKYIKEPDHEELSRFCNVKKITVAPELEGMAIFISKAGCAVSIGHTDCTYEQAIAAIDAGASCLTHTFNAMPPLLHRSPGPIAAALERGIFAELICDGVHVSPPAVKALYKMFGSDRLMLVSDALSCAGMPDGEYSSGGLAVFVKDGIATLADGTLAGGSHSLLDCVKTAASFGIDFWDAVKMATETPARSLGLNKGKLEAGYDADLVILDGDMNVFASVVSGKIV